MGIILKYLWMNLCLGLLHNDLLVSEGDVERVFDEIIPLDGYSS